MNTIPSICALCYAQFEASTAYGLCPLCWSKDRLREFDRVMTALKHARRDDLPATLEFIEWLVILSDWRGRCAYCDTPHYAAIEMVERWRGLVRENVVPACWSCDVHVRNGWQEAEDRVKSYINERRQEPFVLVSTIEEELMHKESECV
jgi:hypothetical protein